MDDNIKIIRVPNKLNKNEIEFSRTYDDYRHCPFCLEANRIGDPVWYGSEEWYGTSDGKKGLFALFKKRHHWKALIFTCDTCGAKWQSPPFRTDYPENVYFDEDDWQ